MEQRQQYPPLLDRPDADFASSFVGLRQEIKTVRDFVGKTLGGSSCHDDAVLLVSEAATNAVLHTASGSGTFDVLLWMPDDGPAVLAVCDQGGPTVPTVRKPTTMEEHGRGVALFDLLADDDGSCLKRWGYRRDGGRTTVWFELDVHGRR